MVLPYTNKKRNKTVVIRKSNGEIVCTNSVWRNKKKSYFGKKVFLVGLSYDHSFISFFVGIWENHFGLDEAFTLQLEVTNIAI
jgi:hypothetical protein